MIHALIALVATSHFRPDPRQIPMIHMDPKHPNLAVEARLDAFWRRASSEVYRSSDEIKAQRNRELRSGRNLPLLVEGNPRDRTIALTFDDGPHLNFTPQLLAALRREGIKATFFVVGKQAELYPSLIAAEDRDGHLIANHTFSHVTLTKIPYRDIRTEYRATNDLIQSITGKRPTFCRPPGGDYDEDVVRAGLEEGMTTVLWTDDPGDFALPAEKVLEKRIEARLSRGGIILLHDGVQETIDLLPTIARMARQRGLRFVTVDQLRPIDRIR